MSGAAPGQSLRTFVAIPLEPSVRKAVAAWQRSLATRLAGIKWVEEDNLHLTLKFLGDTPGHAIEGVCAALEAVAAAHRPFDVVLRGAGTFPPAGSPRVLWVGAEGGDALIALHRGVELGLEDLGWRPEPRSFRPHLTVGRVRQPGPRRDVVAALAAARDRLWGEMRVTGFALLESRLTPRGPIYRTLAHFMLARTGDGR